MGVGVTLARRLVSLPLSASQVSTSRPAAVTNERAARLYSPPASGCGSVSEESSSSGPWTRRQARCMCACACAYTCTCVCANRGVQVCRRLEVVEGHAWKHDSRRAATSSCLYGGRAARAVTLYGPCSESCSCCVATRARMSHTMSAPAASTEQSCAVRPVASTWTIGATWPRIGQMSVSERGFHARRAWSRPA
eukprot:scaffold15814_cov72-Phaeocystis_antarctica.AAC.2